MRGPDAPTAPETPHDARESPTSTASRRALRQGLITMVYNLKLPECHRYLPRSYDTRSWRTASNEKAGIKPKITKESYRPLAGYFSLDFFPVNVPAHSRGVVSMPAHLPAQRARLLSTLFAWTYFCGPRVVCRHKQDLNVPAQSGEAASALAHLPAH